MSKEKLFLHAAVMMLMIIVVELLTEQPRTGGERGERIEIDSLRQSTHIWAPRSFDVAPPQHNINLRFLISSQHMSFCPGELPSFCYSDSEPIISESLRIVLQFHLIALSSYQIEAAEKKTRSNGEIDEET
jgi:hypothetical protein